MKLTRKQWEFLELVERTPPQPGAGNIRPCSAPVFALYKALNIPKELVDHTYGYNPQGMLDKSITFLRLSHSAYILLKYGTCPQ